MNGMLRKEEGERDKESSTSREQTANTEVYRLKWNRNEASKTTIFYKLQLRYSNESEMKNFSSRELKI
jgi:hypothetical protein